LGLWTVLGAAQTAEKECISAVDEWVNHGEKSMVAFSANPMASSNVQRIIFIGEGVLLLHEMSLCPPLLLLLLSRECCCWSSFAFEFQKCKFYGVVLVSSFSAVVVTTQKTTTS
jgi:hypothetical protein